jgi:hypothetical protein
MREVPPAREPGGWREAAAETVLAGDPAARRAGPAARRRRAFDFSLGAAGLAAEAIGTAREAGCTGKIVARFDSAFYNSAVIRAVRRKGAHSPSPSR